MKKIIYGYLILTLTLLGFQFASASSWENEEDITNDIQEELRLADAEMDDEDLFMDDGSGDDWAEEADDLFAEEPSAPAEPAEPVEEPAPEPQEVSQPAPAPAPKPAPAKKPAPKQVVEKAKPQPRNPAGFNQGFKVLSQDCTLHANPSAGSEVILTTPAGRRLWLESASNGWYKGFHKKGHGYFDASCFE